jgi:hypothetical protein
VGLILAKTLTCLALPGTLGTFATLELGSQGTSISKAQESLFRDVEVAPARQRVRLVVAGLNLHPNALKPSGDSAIKTTSKSDRHTRCSSRCRRRNMEPLTIKTPYAVTKQQQTPDHVMTATK